MARENSLIFKRIFSTAMIFCLIGNSLSFEVYGKNILTVDEANTYAMNTSTAYRDKKFSLATKKIQLMQARDAIRDIRKKESTVRFSLLFDIKFPEKHAMPKEIELIMKVPTIQQEIKNITKSLDEIQLKDKFDATDSFLSVFEYDQKSKLSQKKIDEMNQSLAKMKLLLRNGRAKKEDLDDLEKKIKAEESALVSYLKNVDRNREKLSDIVGFNVSSNYELKNPLRKVDIDRKHLDSLISYTLNNDYGLFEAQSAEALAIKNVDEIAQIYGSRWNNEFKIIQADVRSNKSLDYDQFLNKYNSMLTEIDRPWTGNYVINLLFFKIKIPKEWFKGEYDGQRYFEDEKYALFIAMKEKEDAINNTKSVKKELTRNVKDGYETLKDLWQAYQRALELTKKSEASYQMLYTKNKLGLASYSEVDIEKGNWEAAQEQEFDSLLSYNRQLISFNKLTCGAVDALTKNMDVFLKTVEVGDSIGETEELLEDNTSITYYIKSVVDQKRVVFGLQVPSGYKDDITHYEVLTPEKVIIARKTAIGERVSVLPVEYQGVEELFVRLYNNDEFVNEGTFDAMSSLGKINITDSAKTEVVLQDEVETNERKVIGTYSISSLAGDSIKSLRLKVPDTSGVSFYKIVDSKQEEIGSKDKYYLTTEAFSYLGFALNNLSDLNIVFYDAEKNMKSTAHFDENTKEIIENS